MNPLFWLKRLSSIFRRSITASVCGHKTKVKGSVFAFGETITTTMPIGKDGRSEYCLECIGKMAIRCWHCGGAIFIGDPVALAGVSKSKLPDYAVSLPGSKDTFIMCLRISCAPASARSGFWIPPGKVDRIPSAFELALAEPDDCMVVINDSTNPRDKGKVIRI